MGIIYRMKILLVRRQVLFLLLAAIVCVIAWQYTAVDHPLKRIARRGVNNARYYAKKSAIQFRVKSKYDFVAFKKKPGWHFVEFPCYYICSRFSAEVTVRLTTKPSDIIGADAIFFSTGPMELKEWEALQSYRTAGQIWIFATQEPAAIVPDFLPPKVYRYDSYNWSFTFHSTSDINGAYGWYTPHDKPPSDTRQTNWFKEKPKFASWVSSRHCEGLCWDRTKFVKDLAALIPVDMYGACGNLTLWRNKYIGRHKLKNYKFHLSLENSCCSEYLSEKVWNALEHWESVPIVLGGTKEEYQRLMPPHSFIHVDDFKSIQDLAKYIILVGHNETLYNKYFDWRKLGAVYQQSFSQRFPVFEDGVCKVVEKFEELKRVPKFTSFDPYGPLWLGSCYRCGENDWIQDYNFWYRLDMSRKPWEDNRILHWLKEKKKLN